MPKIDVARMPERNGTRYPPPYDAPCRPRLIRRIGDGAGLTDYGASLVTVPPGAWSSQRHWHDRIDELLVMLSGRLVLIDDGGRTEMAPGDIAAFPKNDGNGHHLVNESGADATFLVVGGNEGDAYYPDIDLLYRGGEEGYCHKDGTPY